jgi:hypothetical protein
MKNLLLLMLVVIALAISSCSDTRKDGDWDDVIKLSSKSVELSALADSVTIKTGGSWWWVTNVSVDGKYYNGFAGVDLLSDSYSIRQDCFVVERRDKNTLFIKVEANPNSVKRTITVGLEAGDYFDGVVVTQKAK